MQIEEKITYTMLFDTYGKLLSKKQFEIMEQFLNLDLSESELAEFSGGSRQSVHDAVSKAKKQLVDFESKCGVLKNKSGVKQKLKNLLANFTDHNFDKLKVVETLNDIIENY